ncbi:hypothetical protein C2I18_21420 [Paenibacillus sp. PK3_47]|nr:hypothetical protein C2I18_21420 [Paenibacillus sp. PK3_47]
MNINHLRQAIAERIPLQIHLISGETYRGVCKHSSQSENCTIITDNGEFTFPVWTIKRFKAI